MAQIAADYDLSLGSTEITVGTDVNNIRFHWEVTGGTEGQKVYLYPVVSAEVAGTYDELKRENRTPFEFEIIGNDSDTDRIYSIGAAYASLKIVCDGCTGLLNVFTYED